MKKLSLIPALLLLACHSGSEVTPTEDTGDFLRWGHRDDPSLFDGNLVYTLKDLPSEGTAETAPWAGNYWPVYKDSINHRWAGSDSDSPAAKYGKAFGVEGVEDAISDYYGVDKYASRTECTDDEACDATIAEKCAKREGAEKGHCIPTWWGICHAWAPLSIMEAEPVHPVEHNGVEFKVQDIKALATLAWNRSTSKFISLRCNEHDAVGGVDYDAFGRPTGSDTECRDTNPGTFHVITTNFLGLRHQSFVEDRTFDSEVWNQPVRSYKITKLDEVTADEANALVGATHVGGKSKRETGKLEKDAWAHFEPVDISGGDRINVRLSGNHNSDLYVRFGAQATEQDHDCNPGYYNSNEVCLLDAPADAKQLFVSVRNRHDDEGTYNVLMVTGGKKPEAYYFNDDAKSFRHVQMQLRYIAESDAETDGNLAASIDRYTHSDYYEYVLELDGDGKIIGGEWIGSSKSAHPDFLWLPTGRVNTPIAGGKISYSEVESLLRRSRGDSQTSTGSSERESGVVTKGEWKHYGPYDVKQGSFLAEMSGTGDADLYVRRDAQPDENTYECRPYANGSEERCRIDGAGIYYASVRGYAASSTFTLTVTAGGEPTTPTTAHLDESGEVGHRQAKLYTLQVKAGETVFVRTQAQVDVDLYVRMSVAPTPNTYDASGTSYSGAEVVQVTPPNDGVLHIMVYGYEAGAFSLKTSGQ